ncbi:hypothetical protein R0K17_23380, partial [Planococcus sp. SIMBA_143]
LLDIEQMGQKKPNRLYLFEPEIGDSASFKERFAAAKKEHDEKEKAKQEAKKLKRKEAADKKKAAKEAAEKKDSKADPKVNKKPKTRVYSLT